MTIDSEFHLDHLLYQKILLNISEGIGVELLSKDTSLSTLSCGLPASSLAPHRIIHACQVSLNQFPVVFGSFFQNVFTYMYEEDAGFVESPKISVKIITLEPPYISSQLERADNFFYHSRSRISRFSVSQFIDDLTPADDTIIHPELLILPADFPFPTRYPRSWQARDGLSFKSNFVQRRQVFGVSNQLKRELGRELLELLCRSGPKPWDPLGLWDLREPFRTRGSIDTTGPATRLSS
ncbi:unnamed protein product [Protopolystoma xenopodis]|uniref:Uncharacterized protein n=1 Tax=Protopolystoma xenopodis TaxID=117903 RepID=A0A448WIQ1_9PLAT|nr:unnamed protein product [Protopolystoma xenopodis]